MSSKHYLDRLRLAKAIATYLDEHHPHVNRDIHELVKQMRPRRLRWNDQEATFSETDTSDAVSTQSMSPLTEVPGTNTKYFPEWSESMTPFYFIVDFHTSAANMIMDEKDLDLDLRKMYFAVSSIFCLDEPTNDDEVKASQASAAGSTGDSTAGNDGDADIYDTSLLSMEPMDEAVVAAALQYRFTDLDYLQFPAIETNAYDGSGTGAASNMDENNKPQNDEDNGSNNTYHSNGTNNTKNA